MINIRILAIATALLTVAMAYAEPTPTAVLNFYNGMEKLSSTYNRDIASELESRMLQCFEGYDNSAGINMPNDFKFFNEDDGSVSHDNKTLSSLNYIAKLSEFAFKEKVLKVSVKIMQSQREGRLPDFQSGRLSSSDAYITTLVVKTFRLNGKEWTYNDTVRTKVQTGLIDEITNGNGVIDKNTLRIKASIAYGNKNYREAYRLYEQIVTIDPKDADAYYRLGLMTYWLQGCENKFYKKKYAHKKGKEYLNMAVSYGSSNRNYTISKKAGQVLFWIENPYI